jgi:hypothetical protein
MKQIVNGRELDIGTYHEVVGDVIITWRVNFTDRTAYVKISLPDEWKE